MVVAQNAPFKQSVYSSKSSYTGVQQNVFVSHGSFEFVFYQSGVLVEIKGKKQSRRIHFLVQNAFQIVDSSAVVS